MQFRGFGRETAEEAFSSKVGVQENIFGDAVYSTPSEGFAKEFGPNIEQVTTRLENPLVISTDTEYAALAREAGLRSSAPATSEEVNALRAVITGRGHDGVIIRVPDSELTGKRLQQVFGDDTVVDFAGVRPDVTAAAGDAISSGRLFQSGHGATYLDDFEKGMRTVPLPQGVSESDRLTGQQFVAAMRKTPRELSDLELASVYEEAGRIANDPMQGAIGEQVLSRLNPVISERVASGNLARAEGTSILRGYRLTEKSTKTVGATSPPTTPVRRADAAAGGADDLAARLAEIDSRYYDGEIDLEEAVRLRIAAKAGRAADVAPTTSARQADTATRGAGEQPVIKIDLRKGFGGRAQSLADDLNALGEPNPLNAREVVIDDVVVEISVSAGNLHLHSLRSLEPGSGAGTRVLERITQMADEAGVTIEGAAVPTRGVGGVWVPEARLRAFYERHGSPPCKCR